MQENSKKFSRLWQKKCCNASIPSITYYTLSLKSYIHLEESIYRTNKTPGVYVRSFFSVVLTDQVSDG
jgi:hypothetical protein